MIITRQGTDTHAPYYLAEHKDLNGRLTLAEAHTRKEAAYRCWEMIHDKIARPKLKQ